MGIGTHKKKKKGTELKALTVFTLLGWKGSFTFQWKRMNPVRLQHLCLIPPPATNTQDLLKSRDRSLIFLRTKLELQNNGLRKWPEFIGISKSEKDCFSFAHQRPFIANVSSWLMHMLMEPWDYLFFNTKKKCFLLCKCNGRPKELTVLMGLGKAYVRPGHGLSYRERSGWGAQLTMRPRSDRGHLGAKTFPAR